MKFISLVDLWVYLPAGEREITDILRQIVLENLPGHCTEKLAYNVPCYYGNKRICMIWPASIKGGGIKKGVLLGFSQGYLLADTEHYLLHGTNKRIYYKIYQSPQEIDEAAIILLLREAVALDKNKNAKKVIPDRA